MVESMLGHILVEIVGDGWEKGASTMVAVRPEPLFDWFIPIDGDGVH
jgi:hypothetical protein